MNTSTSPDVGELQSTDLHDPTTQGTIGVFRATPHGRFLDCNEAAMRMLGHTSRAELTAAPNAALFTDEADRERWLSSLEEKGRMIACEKELKLRDGSTLEVLVNAVLCRSPNGPDTIEGTLFDLGAQRRSEQDQRALVNNYRQLVERSRDGILVVQGGSVRYANPAAEELARTPLAGHKLLDLLHPDDREKAGDLLIEAERGNAAGPISVRMVVGGGETKELVLTVAHMLHKGAGAAQVSLQDLGSHKSLLQERLRASVAEEVNQVLRQEILEHRRTQDELRRSRRFARSLINSSLDMIMAADHEGRIIEYNPAASLKFGYEPEEVLGRDTRMLYADSAEFERIQAELQNHGAFAGEIQNIAKDGRVFTSFLAASRLFDEEGRLQGAMGVSRDITLTKRDQEALKASEERYRDLFENAMDLIQSVDRDGRFQYVNRAWKEALGHNDPGAEGLSIRDVVHPEHAAELEQFFHALLRGEGPGPLRTVFVGRAGNEIHVIGNSTVRVENGNVTAIRSIFRDITGVHEAQERVQEHVAKLKALFESTEHMFWTVDERIALTSFNPGYAAMIERLYGAPPQVNTDLGEPRRKFASDAYHAFWEEKYAEAFAGKPMRFETDLVDRSGRRVCNEIFLSPVFDAEGRVSEVFGIGHEITEQKEAEDLVREQGARLKAIFDSAANMMIWTLDSEFRITACNQHFQASTKRAFGLDLGIGDPFLDLMARRVAGKRSERFVAKYQNALKGYPQQFEAELVNDKGRSLWVENFLNPIMVDGEVQEISCLAYGITDKKDAQQKLIESLHEKEVLLKEVHHRVKNNLQVISSILNLQSDHVGGDPRIIELLRDSQARIRSMSFIHESLYQRKDFNSVDLGAYIDGLARNLMMSYSLSGKVALDSEVEAVELGLDQAIPCGLMLNELISNALKHAFKSGRAGTIELRVSRVGQEVRIVVADNGEGLPNGFDMERDANLGLQLVSTLIGQLDGRIEREGTTGTRFAISFTLVPVRVPK